MTGPRRNGFTLIEVVIAILILGVSLSALLSAQYSNVRNASRARDISVATLLARSKMIDIEHELVDEGFTEGEQTDEGDFRDEGHEEIKWKSRVIEIELDLSLLTGLCGGFGEEADHADAEGGCEGMLSQLGPLMEGFTEELANSVRMAEVTVTWPTGPRYTESMTIRGLLTGADFEMTAVPVRSPNADDAGGQATSGGDDRGTTGGSSRPGGGGTTGGSSGSAQPRMPGRTP